MFACQLKGGHSVQSRLMSVNHRGDIVCSQAYCLLLFTREEIVSCHAHCLFFVIKGGDSVYTCQLSVFY